MNTTSRYILLDWTFEFHGGIDHSFRESEEDIDLINFCRFIGFRFTFCNFMGKKKGHKTAVIFLYVYLSLTFSNLKSKVWNVYTKAPGYNVLKWMSQIPLCYPYGNFRGILPLSRPLILNFDIDERTNISKSQLVHFKVNFCETHIVFKKYLWSPAKIVAFYCICQRWHYWHNKFL